MNSLGAGRMALNGSNPVGPRPTGSQQMLLSHIRRRGWVSKNGRSN